MFQSVHEAAQTRLIRSLRWDSESRCQFCKILNNPASICVIQSHWWPQNSWQYPDNEDGVDVSGCWAISLSEGSVGFDPHGLHFAFLRTNLPSSTVICRGSFIEAGLSLVPWCLLTKDFSARWLTFPKHQNLLTCLNRTRMQTCNEIG